jgi:hypothetical protein
MRSALIPALAVLACLTAPALAQTVKTEESELGASRVTLHLHGFLKKDEMETLRVVATHEEALKLFVTGRKGHAAIAAAPREGFIRNGVPVASAVALSELPDAETARRDVLNACNAARKGGPECVVILEVAPR